MRTLLLLGIALNACGRPTSPATPDSAPTVPIESTAPIEPIEPTEANEPSEPTQPIQQEPPPEGPRVQCIQPDPIGPTLVSDADYAARWGVGATKFAEVPTSLQRPLEDCGLALLMPRLASLECNDGSRPFKGDANAAHDSRRGSVGPGGRCGRIIDAYIAHCPEGDYEVFGDMYFCSQDTSDQF